MTAAPAGGPESGPPTRAGKADSHPLLNTGGESLRSQLGLARVVGQRRSGFTEKETRKTWSVLLTAISLLGLVQTLAFSKILPFKPEAKSAEMAALVVQQK